MRLKLVVLFFATALLFPAVVEAKESKQQHAVRIFVRQHIVLSVTAPGEKASVRIAPCQRARGYSYRSCPTRIGTPTQVCHTNMRIKPHPAGWLVWAQELKCQRR